MNRYGSIAGKGEAQNLVIAELDGSKGGMGGGVEEADRSVIPTCDENEAAHCGTSGVKAVHDKDVIIPAWF